MSERIKTECVYRITFSERYGSIEISADPEGLIDRNEQTNELDLSRSKTLWESDSEFHNIKCKYWVSHSMLRDRDRLPLYPAEYHCTETMTLDKCESAIKPLRKISKYMDHAYDVSGNPGSFGQYLLRFLKACKVKRCIIENDGTNDSERWRLMGIDLACQMVDSYLEIQRKQQIRLYGVTG